MLNLMTSRWRTTLSTAAENLVRKCTVCIKIIPKPLICMHAHKTKVTRGVACGAVLVDELVYEIW